MQRKHIPIRKCSGCGERKAQDELIRVVRSIDKKVEDGKFIESKIISLDFTGKKDGRGAYICRNLNCLKLARKARKFERSFSCKIPDEIYEQIEGELKRNVW